MSTINGVAQVRRTATPVQQVTSLFLRVWSAWQKRRRRLKVQTALCALSDQELMDIGATRAEIDYIALQQGRARPDRPTPWRIGNALAISLLFNLLGLISADRAEAQCTAQDGSAEGLGGQGSSASSRIGDSDQLGCRCLGVEDDPDRNIHGYVRSSQRDECNRMRRRKFGR